MAQKMREAIREVREYQDNNMIGRPVVICDDSDTVSIEFRGSHVPVEADNLVEEEGWLIDPNVNSDEYFSVYK